MITPLKDGVQYSLYEYLQGNGWKKTEFYEVLNVNPDQQTSEEGERLTIHEIFCKAHAATTPSNWAEQNLINELWTHAYLPNFLVPVSIKSVIDEYKQRIINSVYELTNDEIKWERLELLRKNISALTEGNFSDVQLPSSPA